MQKRFNILIIDDNRKLAQNLTDVFDANGFRTAVASDGHSALKICRKRQFDLALVDIKLPDIDGLRLVEKLTELRSETEYIMITGHGSLENAIEAVRQRKIASFEMKPLDMVRILVFIRQIAARKKAEDKLRQYREKLEEIVGERTSELRKSNKQLREEIKVRKRTEKAHQESEMKLRSVTASANDAIIILDNIGNISYWNKAAKKILGYSSREVLGKECHILLAPKRFYDDYKKGFANFREAGKGPVIGKTLELVAVKKNGIEFPIELSVSAVKLKGKWNAIGILRDITERKEMEEKLMRQEKLAMLGQLAGGIGHELRNPLGAIKNAAYFLNMALEKPELEVKETLELLDKEISTSERIISSLLGFARPKPPSRHKIDVQEIIDKVVLRATIPEGIRVVTHFENEVPHILADSGQLSQVFGNLVLNATQAMPEGGKLVIESRLDDAKRVAISFTDTGEGIPGEIIKKLFEPLFTTKAKGIGLGLAVTKTLVEGHGGTIKVQSKVGKGSTFTVNLPIHSKS